MATYKDELIKSMEYLGSKDDVMFIGQQIVFRGNPMSTTIETFPKEKMIETPVFEEVQLGMATGIAITGKTVVSFYPRWDFLICATNQLVTHLDKFKHMTGTDAPVIIRAVFSKVKPIPAAAQPEYELSIDITTGISAPPIGIIIKNPIKKDTAINIQNKFVDCVEQR